MKSLFPKWTTVDLQTHICDLELTKDFSKLIKRPNSNRPLNKNKTLSIACLFIFCLANFAYAINESGKVPWELKINTPQDAELAAKYPDGGFFLNLGPTGIRARIYPDKPTLLVVKYVFQDKQSPAKGKVHIDDVIFGANGKKFSIPHIFGRQGHRKGWDGPMMELSRHIEDAQGTDGKLNLMIWPKGDRNKAKNVVVPIKVLGRFSRTYPFHCKRSDKLLIELCDFLESEYKRRKHFGRPHVHAHGTLALMASGNPKYDPLIKKIMSQYIKKRYDPFGNGFINWGYGFEGILMGEYYTLTKDKRFIPAMKSLAEAYPLMSIEETGILTHRSYPHIVRTGRKPYASIAALSGLAMTSMSLFKANNLYYDADYYNKIHQHFLNAVSSRNAEIAYAFINRRHNPDSIGPRHALVELADPKKGLSGRGPGFLCPTGMKGIKKYKVLWPTKADHRWKPLDWIEKERSTNIVIELAPTKEFTGKALRIIKRNHPDYKGNDEPTQPYTTTKDSWHIAPTGLGTAAHLIGGQGVKSWEYLMKHYANTCALSYEHSFNGHGSGHLHGFWNVVGASQADPKKLRKFLDYTKSWLILSQTHNGGMIVQPWTRDRGGANTDPGYGPRTLPTATAALLLSMSVKRLQILGAKPARSTKLNPALALQSGGFKVKYFKREVANLQKGRPLAATINKLSRLSDKNTDKALEAMNIVSRLNKWITSTSEELLVLSDDEPAKHLPKLIQFQRLIKDLEPEKDIQERITAIKAIKNISKLTSAFKKHESITAAVAKQGKSRASERSMDSLRKQMVKLVNEPDLDPAFLLEALRFLNEIGIPEEDKI